MPRYFFNFEREARSVPDFVGRELLNDVAAKAEAIKLAAELAASDAIEGRQPTFEWIEIVDSQQRPVARLRLDQAAREPNRLS